MIKAQVDSIVNEKIPVELGNVQETLLLPLWGRAKEARKIEPLLIDQAAVKIIDRLDYNFSAIAANIDESVQVAWIARSLVTDRVVQRFLEKNPLATIVNIGCVLDTTYNIPGGKKHDNSSSQK